MCNIRKMILDKGFQLYRVAGLVGMHPTSFTEFLNGKRDISDDAWRRLCKLLEIEGDSNDKS